MSEKLVSQRRRKRLQLAEAERASNTRGRLKKEFSSRAYKNAFGVEILMQVPDPWTPSVA